MATSKETKKFAKCREEIQTHTNGNDLTRDFTLRQLGLVKYFKITCLTKGDYYGK